MSELSKVNYNGTLYNLYTEIQNGSVTEEKLSESVIEKLGWQEQESDRSVDLGIYSTIKLARWNNGSVVYTGTLDCIEYAFPMPTVRTHIPEGLSNGVDLFLFGTSDTDTYNCRMRIDHDGTVTNLDSTNQNGSALRLVPDYSDLDVVYLYIFNNNSTNPSEADLDTATDRIIAKVCDMTYPAGVHCLSWVTSSYTKTLMDAMVFGYGDESVKVKTIQFFAPSEGNYDNNCIGVLNSSFTIVRQLSPTVNVGSSTLDYIKYTRSGDQNATAGLSGYTFFIPANSNVVFWYMLSKYFDENTHIIDNGTLGSEYTLSDEDMAFIKEKYPFLGEFKGAFAREINRGKMSRFSTSLSPQVNTNNASYYDILENGADGDWYIYTSYNDLRIKNKQATYGDIIYRKSSTVYLPLDNPAKWGNYKTVTPSSYDIVIVGSGAGGIGAAYALINSGLKVLLVDKMPGLGGTHIQGGLHNIIGSPIGDWFKPLCQDAYNCSAMTFDTYNGSVFHDTTTFQDYWDASLAVKPSNKSSFHLNFNPSWLAKRYYDDITGGGIEVRLRRKFISHNDVDGTITSLTFLNLLTGAEEKVYAKTVIDCTGDVYVGRYNRTLGTDFFIGSDTYDMYHESAASSITVADPYDINTCEILYKYGAHNDGEINNDYTSFPNTDAYADQSKDFPTISGVTSGANSTYPERFFADANGATDNPFDNSSNYRPYGTTVSPDYRCGITKEMLVDYGEEAVHEISGEYARAHYKVYAKTSSTYFMGEYPLLGIREGYRMKCEYMVTQADIEDTITSSNYQEKEIIALSSWYADLHQNTTVNTNAITNTYKNGVPYSAIVPTSYKNLLIACRGYGASHIGLSAIRLIKCMMGLGRAAAFAAKQYVDDGLLDVRDVDVSQLQTECGIGDLLTYLEENVYPYLT